MMSEKAIFAAGCFWGVEEVFRKLPGVQKTTVGYIGGHIASPSYKQVCAGDTGHAEAVLIEYDPKTISYDKLLENFWQSHNPTTLNKQGLDIGTQYRSAIFFLTQKQKTKAEASKKILASSGKFNRSIVTQIVAATEFFPAEAYHQQYFKKNGINHCPI